MAQRQEDADVAIINTCTVKRQTSQRILYALNSLNKSDKKLVVTGCMAGANQDLLERYAPECEHRHDKQHPAHRRSGEEHLLGHKDCARFLFKERQAGILQAQKES